MPFDNYFIIDVETCPMDMQRHDALPEEERKQLINPIDSKAVAIGIRRNGVDVIFSGPDEKKLLEDFWSEWRKAREGGAFIVGFNLLSFDIPFLVTRSFIHQVKIVPFILKSVIDLRDRISAYRYGNTRGTLKEFAALLGLETMGDGAQVAALCRTGDIDGLVKYLKNDLLITDEIFKRARDLSILGIEKW